MRDKILKAFTKAVSQQKSDPIDYNSSANFDWIATCGLPWLKLDIDIPYKVILEEIKQISDYLTSHRTDYNFNVGWSSFCIHGKSYDATREDAYYNDNRPKVWTEEAQKCMPLTVDYFKNTWPCDQYARLRVMLLEPGASIEVHRDEISPGRMRPINIAITQPEDCNFYVEKHGIIPFEEGSAFWIDIGNRHCVVNDSKQNRYHIILHQEIETEEFKNLVTRSYHKIYGNN